MWQCATLKWCFVFWFHFELSLILQTELQNQLENKGSTTTQQLESQIEELSQRLEGVGMAEVRASAENKTYVDNDINVINIFVAHHFQGDTEGLWFMYAALDTPDST